MTACALRPAALTALAGLVLAGCAAAPPTPRSAASQVETAILRTAGPGVRVNGEPVDTGRAVVSGDRVATGPGTSALLEFPDGTSVQLDESSDDVTVSWSGDRLRLAFDDTALLVEKGGGFNIVEVVGKMASFFSWSAFVVVEEAPKSFDLDLFQGNAEFAEPAAGDLGGGEFLEVGPGGPTATGPIDEERARRICARFDRWRFDDEEEDRCLGLYLAQTAGDFDGALLGPPIFGAALIGGLIVLISDPNGPTSTTDTLE